MPDKSPASDARGRRDAGEDIERRPGGRRTREQRWNGSGREKRCVGGKESREQLPAAKEKNDGRHDWEEGVEPRGPALPARSENRTQKRKTRDGGASHPESPSADVLATLSHKLAPAGEKEAGES